MSWALLLAIVSVLALAVVARASELLRMRGSAAERRRAVGQGSARARLQYPHVDLSRCIGCGLCVAACPEEGVLDLLHGQAIVVHGARCVGHGRCAQECPVGAIALTLGDLEERRDIPALASNLESPQVPGLFLAGEVTGFALVRTAISHGVAVASEVAGRRSRDGGADPEVLDLCVVGAGPAGLACSLEAKARGLSFVTLEQDELGGTVAKYPRRKLVMTQPVTLPLHGPLPRTSYTKEELMELWRTVADEHELPIRTGQELVGLERTGDCFRVRTRDAVHEARHVCLALGRRGTPRKLGVPGEELPKVAYSLLDAQGYRDRRILVVGGGDSAVEAALGLSEQPGNEVALSYRKATFSRIKARNEVHLREALAERRLTVLLESEVLAIEPDAVCLRQRADGGASRDLRLPNDEVFVFAGGTPPFQLLEAAGVSFDPADRPAAQPLAEQGTGLARALVAALVLAVVALWWVLRRHDYYGLSLAERAASPHHAALRPSGSVGVALGAASLCLVGLNLAYLMRRSPRVRFALGSLRAWMTVHVATGVLALLLALLHSAMAPRDTVGGHALGALAVLVATGAVGRYFYTFVPRAANGREVALEDVRAELAGLAAGWERTHRDFGERVRRRVDELVASGQWSGGFARRLLALLRAQRGLRHALSVLEAEGRAEGVAQDQLVELLRLARRAHRTALMAAHYEDLRGLLGTWRYVHRWVALLLVLLALLHVAVALRYAGPLGGAP